jgi:AraC-like DNA-binding protein
MELVGFSTDDPDIAQRFLVESYLDNRMRFSGDPARFRLSSTRCDPGPFQIDECELAGRVDFTYTSTEQVFVSRVRAGTHRHRVLRPGGADVLLGVGDLTLGGFPGSEIGTTVEGIHEQVLGLRPAALAAAAARDPGAAPIPVKFTDLQPVSTAHARIWRQTVDAISKLLEDADARAAQLVVGRTERLLAAVTLFTFPNAASAARLGGNLDDARPQTLRLAIAYIEAEPNRDIAIADIARAAHVTSRSVQHAFRRHLDTTPMAYLRKVRLDHTHQALLAADPGDGTTVGGVALDWGFANPSRFSRYYREAYGCTPSETLSA